MRPERTPNSRRSSTSRPWPRKDTGKPTDNRPAGVFPQLLMQSKRCPSCPWKGKVPARVVVCPDCRTPLVIDER